MNEERTPVRDFKDLRVWHAAKDLADAVYDATEEFPKREIYGLTSQVRRAAVSVPSNIAEGYARKHRSEYLQFLSIAQASLAEIETQVELSRRRRFIEGGIASALNDRILSTSRQLRALREAIARASAVTIAEDEPPYGADACEPAIPDDHFINPPEPRAPGPEPQQ